MRSITWLLAFLLAAASGFAATYLLIDARPVSLASSALFGRSATTLYQTDVNLGLFGAGNGVTLVPQADGVDIVSRFSRPIPAGSVVGAAYLNFEASKLQFPQKGRLYIEVMATASQLETSQFLEMRFVQNGLQQTEWKQSLLKIGRQSYKFEFNATLDTRQGAKSETLWLRGDTDGRGRPLTIHSIRFGILP